MKHIKELLDRRFSEPSPRRTTLRAKVEFVRLHGWAHGPDPEVILRVTPIWEPQGGVALYGDPSFLVRVATQCIVSDYEKETVETLITFSKDALRAKFGIEEESS